jgi:hypothetical protein
VVNLPVVPDGGYVGVVVGPGVGTNAFDCGNPPTKAESKSN